MPLKYCDSVRSAHDIPHQGNIRHSTGTGNIYQQLDNLDREEARLLKQYDMWTARASRIEGRMAQINAQRRALLATLEPSIEAAEQSVGLR
ncbi:MAG: hypothetical protein L6435_16900 [Anaerolineae bacterium]|nr:hypothetical protein [Anaerolineae bacterium]